MTHQAETRPERRRAQREQDRAEQYEKSGHTDIARADQFIPHTPRPHSERPYTPEQLMVRAVNRRDYFRMVEKITGRPASRKAPHAYAGTAPRKHYDRSERRSEIRKLYREGFNKPQPAKYHNQHRSAPYTHTPMKEAA